MTEGRTGKENTGIGVNSLYVPSQLSRKVNGSGLAEDEGNWLHKRERR